MNDMNDMREGLIHLYIGDGKGKTTAAAGLAARAAGCGRRVVFAQFLKGSRTGEAASLEALGIRVVRSGQDYGFCWDMDVDRREACHAEQSRIFAEARDAVFVRAGAAPADLLALDEALDALAEDLLDEEELRAFIAGKPEGLELVLTGRDAPEWLKEKAGYITEMKKVRHPYDKGILARESIEY